MCGSDGDASIRRYEPSSSLAFLEWPDRRILLPTGIPTNVASRTDNGSPGWAAAPSLRAPNASFETAPRATASRIHAQREHKIYLNDALQITQSLLAEMLGVQRPTVTNAARELEGANLLARGRRQVTILDRPGLVAASCECYLLVRARIAFHLPQTYA
jgi:hypothetical protein